MMRFDSRNIDLLRELTISQYKLKDQSTFFGLLWSFLNPLFMVAVLFVVFSQRLGSEIMHYGAYLLLGMVQYTYFANATSVSMRVMLAMKQLTKETVFPKELIVLSSVLAGTVDFAVAMLVWIAIALATGVAPAWSQLLIPVVVVLQFLLVVWVSLLLACIFPFARDIEHLYQVFLRALLFLTPIFYLPSALGEGIARYILMLNPLAHLIDLSRRLLIDGDAGAGAAIAALALANAVLVLVAWRVFKTLEPRLAEYV